MPRLARALNGRPRLLVLLVAEQFRPDYLDNRPGALSPGGFRRMLDDGAYFPDCRLDSVSFTNTGLATISTGSFPNMHGEVADNWLEAANRGGSPPPRAIFPTQQGPGQSQASAQPNGPAATLPKVPLKTFAATPTRGARVNSLVPTLTDEITQANRGFRTFAIGLKPAGLDYFAGEGTRVFSMDPQGRFAETGGPAEPAKWIADFGTAHPILEFKNANWIGLRAGPGAPPMRSMPNELAYFGDFLNAIQSSPFGQSIQFEFLKELIVQENLGRTNRLDVVTVVLNSLGMLGYQAGANSPLMQDCVARLDTEIERLLDLLLQRVGADGFDVVFTAAHGAPADPRERRPQLAVRGEDVAEIANRALSERFNPAPKASSDPKPNYVEAYLYPFLYLHREGLRRAGADLRASRLLAGNALLASGAAVAYYTADGDCSQEGLMKTALANSFQRARCGDLLLVYAPGAIEDNGRGRGISYGSVHRYDTEVPLIFYGAQFGPLTVESPVSLVDVAPTLARVLGVEEPAASTGAVLGKAFKDRTA